MYNRSLSGFFSEINTVPPVLQNSYYPSLNGLRGIAIILVVFSHLNVNYGIFYLKIYQVEIFNGGLGVQIFFVLSGFLITTLCIKEKVITENISLKNFYLRRVLRIFPVAYLFLLVIIVLNILFNLKIGYINLTGAAFYLMDITTIFRKHYFSWYTVHFWSLSVEEQFYLIIPFILKKNFMVFLGVLLFIIFALPVIICLQYYHIVFNDLVSYAFVHILIKFQGIAVGCLCAVLVFKYSTDQRIMIKTKLPGNITALVFIMLLQYDELFSLKNVFSGLLISLLTGYIILSNLNPSKDFIYKVLNTKILKTIGVLSYSIYIWQQIFTSNDHRLPGFMVVYPFNLICLIIVSFLSYYLYESYFLKLKSKFSAVQKNKQAALADSFSTQSGGGTR